MRALFHRLQASLRSIGLLGHCYLCNVPIKFWHRSGYAYVDHRGKKLYRALLCKDHYEGYHMYPAVRSAVNGKVLKHIRAEIKAGARKNPK